MAHLLAGGLASYTVKGFLRREWGNPQQAGPFYTNKDQTNPIKTITQLRPFPCQMTPGCIKLALEDK